MVKCNQDFFSGYSKNHYLLVLSYIVKGRTFLVNHPWYTSLVINTLEKYIFNTHKQNSLRSRIPVRLSRAVVGKNQRIANAVQYIYMIKLTYSYSNYNYAGA